MKTLGSLLLLAALAARSAAADTTFTSFRADLPVDFTPALMATPDADGVWIVGSAGSYPLELVRYRNDGSVVLTQTVLPTAFQYARQIAALPDGGVAFSATNYDDACQIRRYDAAGTMRWSSAQVSRTDFGCYAFSVDGAGGIWIVADKVYRLGADGTADAQIAPGTVTVNQVLGDPTGAGAFLIGVENSGLSVPKATVERVSEHGELLWKASPVQTVGAAFARGAVAADGSVFALGTTNVSANSVGAAQHTIFAAKFGADGHVLWQHADAPSSLITPYAAVVAADGAAVFAYSQGGDATLAKSGPTADAFAWTLTPGLLRDCDAPHTLASVPNGDVLVGCASNNSSPYSGTDLRVSPHGAIVQAHLSPYTYSMDLQALADSSELRIVQHFAQYAANGTLIGGAWNTDISRFATDGSAAPAPQTSAAIAMGGDVDAGAFGPDGSAYVVTDSFDRKQSEIARIGPSGDVVWRQRLTGVQGHRPDVNYYPVRLAVTPEAVCMVLASGVACYALADGALRGHTALSGILPVQYPLPQTLADGSVEILYYDTGVHQLLLSASGSVISNRPFPAAAFENINASGASIVQPPPDAIAYSVIARDGTHTYDASVTPADGAVARSFLADDGTALVLTATNARSSLMRVDAHGAKLWSRSIDARPSAPFARYDDAYGFVIRDGYAYLVLSQQFGPDGYGDFPPAHYTYTVEKIALADGSVAWSVPFDGEPLSYSNRLDFNIAGRSPQLLVDDAGRRVLVTTAALPNRVRTQLLDAASGALLSDQTDGCGGTTCLFLAAAFGSDGAARVLLDTVDAQHGHFQTIRRQAPPLEAAPTVRADQAGIAGAWYAPYASGQGFNIDYFRDSGTVFMPWFTYTSDGGDGVAGLAWYALQGTAASGAHSVDLAITAADPGVFASGSVGVHAVGSAQLRFADCDDATLSYRFTGGANGNAAGTISLHRLLPSTDACVADDGSRTPAQAPLAAAQGFDVRQSGSWYDAATSGQGLEITVLPPGGGSGGLLFAAWFTFDPAGAADDAAHAHWFTLQGDLASATNGTVSLPILRTIGGTLDAQPTGDTVQVGTATLTFTACDAAQLDYRFDRPDTAHAFLGIGGTIHLAKIRGCAGP